MGSKFTVKHYFLEGITARGYISLLPILSSELQRLYILLGGPGTGKSTLIKTIGLELYERGYEVDFWRSALDSDSVAGFFLPKFNIGMIDHLEVSPIHWKAPGAVEKFIDFNQFLDEKKLHRSRKEIIALTEKIKALQKKLESQVIDEYKESCRGLKLKYRPWSSLYRKPVAQDSPVNGFEPWPQAKIILNKLQMSKVSSCFLHGLSPAGWVNLAPHFLADCDLISFEGEDTVEALNWILYEAKYLGQVMKVVLHPLDPDRVIGLVFPERNLALWQGTPKSDKRQNEVIQPLTEKIKEILMNWQHQKSLLKRIYTETVDFIQIDSLKEEILNQLLYELVQS